MSSSGSGRSPLAASADGEPRHRGRARRRPGDGRGRRDRRPRAKGAGYGRERAELTITSRQDRSWVEASRRVAPHPNRRPSAILTVPPTRAPGCPDSRVRMPRLAGSDVPTRGYGCFRLAGTGTSVGPFPFPRRPPPTPGHRMGDDHCVYQTLALRFHSITGGLICSTIWEKPGRPDETPQGGANAATGYDAGGYRRPHERSRR